MTDDGYAMMTDDGYAMMTDDELELMKRRAVVIHHTTPLTLTPQLQRRCVFAALQFQSTPVYFKYFCCLFVPVICLIVPVFGFHRSLVAVLPVALRIFIYFGMCFILFYLVVILWSCFCPCAT